MARKINLIIVHCSATTSTQDIGRADIDRWHREKGWDGIGYHHVIRRDGRVEAGRSEARVGAHAEGYNKNSIGVCMVGGVERVGGKLIARDNFTPAQWDALRDLIGRLHAEYPEAKIIGHRDVNRGKECPSFSVRDWLNRENLLADGIAWNSGVVHNKPAMKRPTVQGTAMSFVGGTGAALTDAAGQVQMVADYSQTLRIVFVVLMLAGIGLTLYGAFKRGSERQV